MTGERIEDNGEFEDTQEQGGGLVEDAIRRMHVADSGAEAGPDLRSGAGAPRAAAKKRRQPRVVDPQGFQDELGSEEIRHRSNQEQMQREPVNEVDELSNDYEDDDFYRGGGGNGGISNGESGGRFAGAGNWMQWGVTALIAIVISYAMMGFLDTSKNEIASISAEVRDVVTDPMKTVENQLRTDLDNLTGMAVTSITMGDYALQTDLAGFAPLVTLEEYVTTAEMVDELEAYTVDLSGYATDAVLEGYVTTLELETAMEGTAPPDVGDLLDDIELDVEALGETVDLLEGSMGDIVDTVAELQMGDGSRIDYSLTGSGTSFRLNVVSPETGWYVGYVTLVYRTPPALSTANNTYDQALVDFYARLSDHTRVYIPKMVANTVWTGVTYEVTGWGVGEVSFFTSRFKLDAGEEKELTLYIGGLNAFPGYETYIDVLVSSVASSESGGGAI